jgi:hypothetical protein
MDSNHFWSFTKRLFFLLNYSSKKNCKEFNFMNYNYHLLFMKIPTSEVYLRSTENGLLIHKYQLVRTLQNTLSILNNKKGKEKIVLSSFSQMEPHKIYYIQDYLNKRFYYELSEKTLQQIKLSVDNEISSLVSCLAGMVDVMNGLTTPVTKEQLSKNRLDRFSQNKIEINEI